jgi:hypothetical protein
VSPQGHLWGRSFLSQGAAEQRHEPVGALELKMSWDAPSIINVRPAGYAYCYTDPEGQCFARQDLTN